MRVCAACGQPVPLRWRNTDRRLLRLAHRAGPVVVVKAPRRPGWPWGKVVDRVQSCTTCTATLVRGPWASFFTPGQTVIEHGAGASAPILVDVDADGDALPCG